MTYPIQHKNIAFEVNALLKEYQIEAKLEEINKLSTTIKKIIEFNQNLYRVGTLEGVSLATTVKDLIEIFMLRSEVYRKMGYSNEFPEPIKGLDFDEYDEVSAILYSKRKDKVTGTCRLIFDTNRKLPIDKKFSLDYLRNSNRLLAEGSRVIIKDGGGLNREFKFLTIDVYRVLEAYKMNLISVMTQEHLKMYSNFGGFGIEKRFQTYGTLDQEFFVTLWQVEKISPFFKRVFLRDRKIA